MIDFNLLLAGVACVGVIAYGVHVLGKKRQLRAAFVEGEVPSGPLSPFARRFAGLAALSFLVIGVVGVWTGIMEINNVASSAGWPTTSGVVTESRVVSNYTATGTETHGIMRYVYEVNGRRYKSANVASTGLVGLGRGLEHVGKYPRQAKVTVYYNPDHPATALLEPGEAVQRTGQWAVGIGGIFLLLGGLALQVYRGKIAVR